MSDSHHTMTSSRARSASSTSGYLILLAFLTLLALTVWRIIAFAGSHPDDSAGRTVPGRSLRRCTSKTSQSIPLGS